MASLFQLTEEYQRLLEWAEDPEIDPVAFADTLECLQFEFEKKAEGYCMVIRQLEADMKAYNDAAQEFTRKKTVCEASIKRMKDALKRAMELTGHDDKNGLDAGLFKLKVVGNGGQRPIVYDGQVPEQFVKMVPQNDTEQIRRFLDGLGENGHCDWAHYEERGTHLSIK